jgi:hypothetical protein
MRRARGKTAKRGKNPENYSMSLKTRTSAIVSPATVGAPM